MGIKKGSPVLFSLFSAVATASILVINRISKLKETRIISDLIADETGQKEIHHSILHTPKILLKHIQNKKKEKQKLIKQLWKSKVKDNESNEDYKGLTQKINGKISEIENDLTSANKVLKEYSSGWLILNAQ